VSIARAFLKQAPTVLIDEAATALDPKNEAAISHAIADLASDPTRTVIIVAHRPATLAAADHVVSLDADADADADAVAETGAPAALRGNGGVYDRLYRQSERAQGWRLDARPR
jgi:ATP-binding cassette subfamily B protein